MRDSNLIAVLTGMVSMASLVAALVFLRYWRRSHDRLFLYFCIAFFLDAGVRVVQGLQAVADESEMYVFLTRLATFALIAWGIADKNRRAGRPP
jgi:hypothetical protein